LENGDAVDVIDTSRNEATAHVPVGQAPQALVFVTDAVPQGSAGRMNLIPRPSGPETVNIALKAPQGIEGAGAVVSRNLGLVDILDVSVSQLKPDTVYSVFLEGRDAPIAVLKTNSKGMGMVSTTGPTREIRPSPAGNSADRSSRVIVIEGEGVSASASPVLAGG
jgi:hypothetical protein